MSDKITTPEARVSFVRLFEPGKDDLGRDVYEITLIFEPDTDISELKRICAQAKDEAWGSKPPSYVQSPFRMGVQKSEQNPRGYDLDKYPEYEGKIIVAARSVKVQPGVVDARVQPILDANEVYSGCYGRASITAFAFGPSLGKGTNKKNSVDGITFSLQNFQKTREGERLGGGRSKPEDDFAAFVTPDAVGENYDLLGV